MTKIAFVTGAAQGIGAAIAKAFHDRGMSVVMTDRSAAVEAVAQQLDPSGASAVPMRFDVSDEAAFNAAFAAAVDRFGRVDVMVNNASVTIMRSVWQIDVAEWDSVMAINLRGTFFGCRIGGEHMRGNQGGRIINLASIAGQRGGTTTGAHYAASKAGIIVLTKIFAQELAAAQVTVNAIAPAAIGGPMVDALTPQVREGLERTIPVGRFGLDREVAAAAVYLASDDAAYVTGSTLDVNGGLLMR